MVARLQLEVQSNCEDVQHGGFPYHVVSIYKWWAGLRHVQ